MRSSVIGDEGVQPYKFSSCSLDQFLQWMDEGQALCLLNKPNQARNLSHPTPKCPIFVS